MTMEKAWRDGGRDSVRTPAPPHTLRPDCNACQAGGLSLCSKVDKAGLKRLQAMSRTSLFLRHAFLCRQDEELANVFVITDGMVKLYHLLPDGRRQITGFLGPGDLLGGLKRSAPVHCTAEAITDVTTCTFDRVAFLNALHDWPELAFELLISATDEIEAQQDHIILLGRKRPQERLAAFLLVLQHRFEVSNGGSTQVHIPMQRADIADYLGLTVETVSRTFTRFKTLGYIKMIDTHLVGLSNLAALSDLSGFDELPMRSIAIGL